MFGIVLAALLFGLGHIPLALILTEQADISLYLYILVGKGGVDVLQVGCFISMDLVAHMTMLILG